MNIPTLSLALLVAGLLAAPAAAQSVHIVAGDGSGDFVQLQAAVDAAADGDVILVRPHLEPYDPTIVAGKGLVLVGEGASRPALDEVIVRDLPADRTVVLRHLTVEGSAELRGFMQWELHDGLILVDNVGCVWIEDVLLAGDEGWSNWGDLGFGRTGLVAVRNDCVLFVRSEIRGGEGGLSTGATPYPGGPATNIIDSSFAFHGTTVVGGEGSEGVYGPGQTGERGGDGLAVTNSLVFASGSTFLGGDTGLGDVTSAVPTATGLVLQDGNVVHRVDTVVSAGGGDAPAGDDVLETGAPGVFVDLGEAHRQLTVPATLREGVASLMTYAGVPGDLVLLQASFTPDFVPLYQGLAGVLHRGPVAAEAVIGVAGPPLGGFTSFLLGPPLPVGVEGVAAFAQPVILTPGGDLRLGSPSMIALLDGAVPTP